MCQECAVVFDEARIAGEEVDDVDFLGGFTAWFIGSV